MTEQQFSHYQAADNSVEPSPGRWRNELQDRLASYRRRRGRRIEGAYTMRFPFPGEESETDTRDRPATQSPPGAAGSSPPLLPGNLCLGDSAIGLPAEPLVDDSGVSSAELVRPLPEPSSVAEGEAAAPFVDPISRPRPKRKVIAFPRQLSLAPAAVHRLADPVTTEAPRILDVPEELEAIPATPFLDGLQFDLPNAAEVAKDRDHVELPFQTAAISRRVAAGVVDLAVTGAGVAIFAAVAYKILGSPLPTRSLALGLTVSAIVLWSAYQYLFLIHGGKTPGMMAARMRLYTFQGKVPNLSQRRVRLLGLCLSTLSLAMGLMWALVDGDGLCWHDRISHTYLSPYP